MNFLYLDSEISTELDVLSVNDGALYLWCYFIEGLHLKCKSYGLGEIQSDIP